MSLFFSRRGELRTMQAWAAGWGSQNGSSVVTEHNAPHLAPVFAALRHITTFAASLPVDAYRANDDGSRTETALPLLLRSQNAMGRQGVRQWVGQAMYGLAAYGNAVGWVAETDGFGFPAVVPWLRRQDWSFDEGRMQWYVYGEPVPASRIFHIPWMVPTGHTLGLSPIEHYATIVRAGLSAQEYADVRRGGGLPPAVLKNNRLALDPEQAAAVRERAVAAFQSGKPFVAGADWDLSIMAIPPNHAQFIETLKLTANAIAAIYGLDPREIGGSAAESLTYKTDESRSLNRANDMRPYLECFEDAVNRVLPEKQFIKLCVDATIRTDIKTRTEVQDIRLRNGTLSRNEVRAMEDQPPIPGGDSYEVTAAASPNPPAAPDAPQGVTP